MPPCVYLDTIGYCIVAKCGYFRAGIKCQIEVPVPKWSFPENRVLLYGEKLSVRHPDAVNGGGNDP